VKENESMNSFLQPVTDRVTTKKGMWITLGIWLLVTMLLAVLAPSAKEYEVSSIDSIPADAKSTIARIRSMNTLKTMKEYQPYWFFKMKVIRLKFQT
jgi:hypothetical protein